MVRTPQIKGPKLNQKYFVRPENVYGPAIFALRTVDVAPWEAWWGSTPVASQRAPGTRSERGLLGRQGPGRQAEASAQKIPARQAPSVMGGKADGTASSPDTDQGPKRTDKAKPSSQYMKALQG